jgi:hypothetical protein
LSEDLEDKGGLKETMENNDDDGFAFDQDLEEKKDKTKSRNETTQMTKPQPLVSNLGVSAQDYKG